MKICRFLDDRRTPQYALVTDSGMVPLSQLMDSPPDDKTLFDRWEQVVAVAGGAAAASAEPIPERLLPPVPPPEKLICIGLNYLDHALESGAAPPSEPVVFSKFNTALIGHGEAIELPRLSKAVDYEAELVVVIGRTGRDIAEAQALAHVAGYTCGHDVSARDWQLGRPGGQWLLGKSFDTFAPLGPWLVSSDEIPDPSDLRVQMLLGDTVAQDSTTAQLIFSIPRLVAHLSGIMTLRPGDLIFTGTPPGVGAARTPPRYLHDGDVCSVNIERIGRLTNRCVAQRDSR